MQDLNNAARQTPIPPPPAVWKNRNEKNIPISSKTMRDRRAMSRNGDLHAYFIGSGPRSVQIGPTRKKCIMHFFGQKVTQCKHRILAFDTQPVSLLKKWQRVRNDSIRTRCYFLKSDTGTGLRDPFPVSLFKKVTPCKVPLLKTGTGTGVIVHNPFIRGYWRAHWFKKKHKPYNPF